MAKLKSGTRIYGTATIDTSVVVGSAVTVNSSGIQVAGIVTASSFSGNATSATYATNAGVSTSVIGGIGSLTQLQVTGVSTFNNNVYIPSSSVGLGTTNPLQTLQVGTANTLGVNTTGTVFVVTSNADVGIGTTNPIVKLDVRGNVNITGFTTLGTGATTTATLFTNQLSVSGVSTFAGITTHTASLFGTQASFTGVVTASSFSGNASSATYATTAGVSTSVIGGIGSITQLQVTGVSTFTNGPVLIGGGTSTGTAGQVLQVTGINSSVYIGGNLGIGATNPTSTLTVTGSGTTTTQLYVSGVSTFVGITTNTSTLFTNQLSVSGVSTFAGITTHTASLFGTQASFTGVGTFISGLNVGTGGTVITTTGIGSVGIGTTNPSQSLHVQGNARVTGAIYDSTDSPGTSGQVLQSTVTGTQWTTAAAGGGSGKFDTTIDNVLYIQPTGTLDIVGVGTTTTQITTLPSGSNKYIVHSIHVTNISNGDAEITAGFILNNRKVPASISVSAGSSGGAGIHTFTVGSASSITVGMAVTGTGNIGETTGIGSTAGFQFNTYVTSVDGTNITLSKPMSGYATGTLQFSPVSKVSSRLPVPVGSAVELLKQPMVLNALDSIVLQSTGAGSGIGSTSTNAVSQTANSNFLTVTAGAAITNFLTSGMLVQGTGNNTGIQTNTFVGVGYTPGSLSIPLTRPATTSLASTSYSFTEVVVPQDGALQATIVYQSSTDTSYQNGTGTVVGIVTLASQATSPVLGITSTVPLCYYGTGNTYPSIVQSIRVSNISDGSIYPGGDYPVWVGIGNSDTVFSWLAYNMIIPKNSSIELCESPKRIGIGQSIFAYASTPGTIEIQIAAKQKTT